MHTRTRTKRGRHLNSLVRGQLGDLNMAQAVASASKVPPTPSTLSRADKIRFNDLIKRAKELEGSENADDVKVRVPFEDVVEWHSRVRHT
jgi:hypothetical protein